MTEGIEIRFCKIGPDSISLEKLERIVEAVRIIRSTPSLWDAQPWQDLQSGKNYIAAIALVDYHSANPKYGVSIFRNSGADYPIDLRVFTQEMLEPYMQAAR